MRYLFVGGSTIVIDMFLLVLLHGVLNINIAVATSVAYWVSIAYNFSLNRWWTFGAGESKKLYEHIISYGILLGFNYLFTVIFVSAGSRYMEYWLAKIIAIALQITWTYPIYKNIIFKEKK